MPLLLDDVFDIREPDNVLFVFSVFLISLLTDSYIYGIASSFLAVLAVNYAFTFPYFTFNFTLTENLISAALLIVVAVLTSALTMKLRQSETEKVEAERERVRANLLRAVSHDLRTPLTSIIGYLGWVRTRTDLDEETRNHYIDIAYQKALRLEQLTNELFGFVKLEHKEMQLHLGKLDLVQLMEQMLDEMTPSFVKNELQVEFLHAEHAIFLEADGELLARLFGNLLNNAVKYGKEGKQIRVSMEKEGEYVVTRVINYGRIIPKQELDHIFQKFYRTEQSRSRDTGGTGLGLAIVQQIAELHHGQVRVKSDLQGTVFEVELPVGMPKGKKEDEKR